MRVLIVADNASRRFGGEAFLPLNYFRLLLARKVDVLLMVHDRNRSELESAFPDHRDRLFFVKDTRFQRLASRSARLLPHRLASLTTDFAIQLTTQASQRSAINRLAKIRAIDVIHVPTPVSPRTPSVLFGLNAPVVMGPFNGGMAYPPAFRRREGPFTRLAVALGRSLATFLNAIFPGKRKAQLILVANRRTFEALPGGITGRVVELVENGVDLAVWRPGEARADQNRTVKLIFVGRLVDWKAVEIILEAIRRLGSASKVSLEIIGDGPMRKNWQTLSEAMGLGSIVTFSGWMSQADCAVRLRQADALLLPSLFECGGAAVLEAMATGLPVVATAWGGPLDYLDDSCGILVPPLSKEILIEGFSAAIEKLAASPALRKQLGQSGYERATRHFDWDGKIDRILELYASVVRRSASGNDDLACR